MRCPATSWLQRTKSRTENTKMPPRLNAVEIDTPPIRPAATLPQGSAAARDWRSCFRPVRAQDRSPESESYDLLEHLAPIVEQVISSLKWDSSQVRRPWRCCTGQPG
jgi:hypothetical protein